MRTNDSSFCFRCYWHPPFCSGNEWYPKDSSALSGAGARSNNLPKPKSSRQEAIVNIKSRAGHVGLFFGSGRSEKMFLAIWQFVNDQTEEAFDKDEARLLI